MSMDKDAILQIQESANIPSLIKQINDSGNQVPLMTLPKSFEIQSLEKFMPVASRYRLNYKTTNLEDFISYNELHDQDGSTCFIDAETMTAESIFDLGSLAKPGHKENKAKITLKKSALFSRLLSVSGEAIGQKQAGELIEDWADLVRAEDQEGDVMAPYIAAQALQDLTIETARNINSKVEDFGASMDAFEKIEAKSKHKLPSRVIFTVTPYNGLEEREVTMRVGILTGSEKPKIVFRIVKLEALQEELSIEFKDKIVDGCADLSLKTFIGEV